MTTLMHVMSMVNMSQRYLPFGLRPEHTVCFIFSFFLKDLFSLVSLSFSLSFSLRLRTTPSITPDTVYTSCSFSPHHHPYPTVDAASEKAGESRAAADGTTKLHGPWTDNCVSYQSTDVLTAIHRLHGDARVKQFLSESVMFGGSEETETMSPYKFHQGSPKKATKSLPVSKVDLAVGAGRLGIEAAKLLAQENPMVKSLVLGKKLLDYGSAAYSYGSDAYKFAQSNFAPELVAAASQLSSLLSNEVGDYVSKSCVSHYGLKSHVPAFRNVLKSIIYEMIKVSCVPKIFVLLVSIIKYFFTFNLTYMNFFMNFFSLLLFFFTTHNYSIGEKEF